MSKSKKSGINYILIGVEIALVILLICSLFMPIFSFVPSLNVGSASISDTYSISAYSFIEEVFNGNITGFLVVAITILYLLVLLLSVGMLVLNILALCNVKIKFKGKKQFLEIILVALAIAMFVLSIIWSATSTVKEIGVTFQFAISWAAYLVPISAIGCLLIKSIRR